MIFIFANFFFKIHFGHFFMSNFKNKKKVLKTPTFSIFSTPEKLSFIPRKSIFCVFFMEFAFWEELFIIYCLSFLFCVILIDFMSFFILSRKKYIFIKYFFIINVPINYPPLSKKSLNLSKSCPTEPKKIRKIPKNSEKSRFFSFFTYGLIALFAKSRVTIYHTRS